MFSEVLELLFSQIGFRVQFVEISLVEPSRDGFVDPSNRSVIPESRVFRCGVETIDLSRADNDMRSVNHIKQP